MKVQMSMIRSGKSLYNQTGGRANGFTYYSSNLLPAAGRTGIEYRVVTNFD